jgi:hypothetical protein
LPLQSQTHLKKCVQKEQNAKENEVELNLNYFDAKICQTNPSELFHLITSIQKIFSFAEEAKNFFDTIF